MITAYRGLWTRLFLAYCDDASSASQEDEVSRAVRNSMGRRVDTSRSSGRSSKAAAPGKPGGKDGDERGAAAADDSSAVETSAGPGRSLVKRSNDGSGGRGQQLTVTKSVTINDAVSMHSPAGADASPLRLPLGSGAVVEARDSKNSDWSFASSDCSNPEGDRKTGGDADGSSSNAAESDPAGSSTKTDNSVNRLSEQHMSEENFLLFCRDLDIIPNFGGEYTFRCAYKHAECAEEPESPRNDVARTLGRCCQAKASGKYASNYWMREKAHRPYTKEQCTRKLRFLASWILDQKVWRDAESFWTTGEIRRIRNPFCAPVLQRRKYTQFRILLHEQVRIPCI